VYTNPSNIIKTLVALLERNAIQLNRCIQEYQPDRQLCVFEGMRNVLPADAYPSFEVEPTNANNEWMTTRSQRPRFNFTCTLTVVNSNEEYGVEYISTVATRIASVMTSPENLQLRVANETKWTLDGGLVDTYILDSLVEDISYNAFHEGSVRTAEFSWFATIHETYPDSKFVIGDFTVPTVLRPQVAA
jgi:hypothetical protein